LDLPDSFCHDGQGALQQRPFFQYAVQRQAEIVVQVRCDTALNGQLLLPYSAILSARFHCLPKSTFAAVFF
jgi:hypothetical protein